MLTFSDIRSRVLRMIDEADSTSTHTTSLANELVNAAHRRLCLSRPWPFMLWPQRESFATTVGTRLYALNPSIGRILWLYDTEGRRYVELLPRRNHEQQAVNPSATNSGRMYANWGAYWPVKAQPAASGTLSIVSSSASDTGGPTVVLRGIDSTGEIVSETVTATGTSTATTSNAFTQILNVSKTGTWVGTLTLTDSSANTLLTLTATQSGKQYPTLEFAEAPASAHTILYHFIRTPQTLTNDSDLPEIPFPFSEVLVYEALVDWSAYNSELGVSDRQLWEARREELLDQLSNATAESIVGSAPRYVRDTESPIGHPAYFLE